MAYGRNKMLLGGELVSPSTLHSVMRDPDDEHRELQVLRCTNAHLMRELAELRTREAEAQQQWQCVGLLFIDLNGFKGINDEYGHAAGDKILSTVATRIAARVRTGDIVCRYGGDEFVVILPSVPDAAAVNRVADTIRERVALPYWIDGNEQHLTAAIGESMYPHDGDGAEVLLHRADQAMYRLKARLARPMPSLGGVPRQPPSRRRNDKSKALPVDHF